MLLPGLVTETCAVPGVAMLAAGIMTLSMFAIGWVVLGCGAAFQFTTAFALKLLPVTIKVKSEPPCCRLAGMIAATTGTMPGCVICFGRLYPQPKAARVRNNRRIVLMKSSIRQIPLESFNKRRIGGGQAAVLFLYRKCLSGLRAACCGVNY